MQLSLTYRQYSITCTAVARQDGWFSTVVTIRRTGTMAIIANRRFPDDERCRSADDALARGRQWAVEWISKNQDA